MLVRGQLDRGVEVRGALRPPLGLDVDGDILDVGQVQQAAAHLVADGVALLHGEAGGHPHVQIHGHAVHRSPAADAVEALHPGHLRHHLADALRVQRGMIHQGGDVLPHSLHADAGDDHGHDQGHHRVRPGIAQPDQPQAHQHARR